MARQLRQRIRISQRSVAAIMTNKSPTALWVSIAALLGALWMIADSDSLPPPERIAILLMLLLAYMCVLVKI